MQEEVQGIGRRLDELAVALVETSGVLIAGVDQKRSYSHIL
jgi:hypothetical protein